jgi:hypothetical protein
VEAAQKICKDSEYDEVIGFGPHIALDELKGGPSGKKRGLGRYSKKKVAAYLSRCVKQLATPENMIHRIHEDAAPECFGWELLETTNDVADFVGQVGN